MHSQGFNYGLQDSQETEHVISSFVRDSIQSVTSAPRRGYPVRSTQPRPHHDGLGYHSLSSMEASNQSYDGWAQSGRGTGRGHSGMSDARLLVPVAFVKSVGKTGLEDGQKPEPAEIKVPDVKPKPPPPPQQPRHQLGPKIPEGFSFPPPPEFAMIRDGLPMQMPRPTPPKSEQSLVTAEQEPVAKEAEVAQKVEVAQVTEVTMESDSVAVQETVTVASEVQPEPETISEAAPTFVIDTVGDPTLASAVASSEPTTAPLGAAKDSEDEEDDVVVWRPSVPEPSSSTPFARTIDDPISAPNLAEDASSSTDDGGRRYEALSPKMSKKAVKAAARRRKAERKRRARLEEKGERFSFQYSVLGHDGKSKDAPGVEMGQPREGDSDLDWGDDGPPKAPAGVSRKEREEAAVLADYVENTKSSSDEEADETIHADRPLSGEAALRAFVKGMGGENQTTLDDLRDLQRMQQEDEEEEEAWETDSDESDEGARKRFEVDSDGDMVLNLTEELSIEDLAIAGSSDSSDSDDDDDEEDEDEDEEEEEVATGVRGLGYSTPRDVANGKGKARAVSAEPSDSDSDDDVFEGDWGEPPRSGDRDRSKLYKAIEQGDFSIYDFEDAPRKGRPAGGDDFDEELQGQWERDRKKKADKKKQRASDRQASESMTKKERRKADKRAGRSGAASSKGEDETSLPVIDRRIKEFIAQPELQALSLPPMAKRARMGVHLLAQVYGLKSKSTGKGTHRYPVLERTTRTTLRVDEFKVATIVGVDTGSGTTTPGGGRSKAKKANTGMGGLWREFVGVGPGAIARNREGSIVGHGAEELGEDNIGFQLLAKMGWAQGDRIGLSGFGLAAPIAAVVKNTKGGLGMAARR